MSFTLERGNVPLLVSMPHTGTEIPIELQVDYAPRALGLEDTDWHLQRLYDFLPALGASVITPRYSRYVIDLNRPPDDAPMYPGASNTELCPTHFFNGDALYKVGRAPDLAERLRRREMYWQPYHAALAAELARLKAEHGFVLLWDAHSIRSEIPWLFEGRLPDLNIGTAHGAAAHACITDAAAAGCAGVPGVSSVVNGRFKGGYITRHYGRPAQHVHAVQLEKCQSLYMQEVSPFAYDETLAQKIQPVLNKMVSVSLAAARKLYAR
ncbi:MAG: N-formylglutamate deformylase [Pseudomonadota bacterium]|uniref:N-formylglutamate deformylase n=1 Tax=Polaromonas sp. TaxID=1869339 RepID=UPI0017B09B65|nr:N-formylglutamate deformylase [Polaromonas sp.]MBA3593893.1 N-formylglutamate deformylase [Polaromonas sp.]MDQ3271693.1 N-formylglutamate deformylase [Pseudomonadota bacterium]